MPTLEDIANDSIYLEANGNLSSRIDFAWETYQNEVVDRDLRKKSLQFLMYALDIHDV